MSRLARLTARMDQLCEYDREPVQESALEPGRHFAGLNAGEHVASASARLFLTFSSSWG